MQDRRNELEWVGTSAIYNADIAQIVLDTVKDGFSLRASAGKAGIPYRVAAQWVDNHPTFGYDVELAMAQRVYRLEADVLTTEDPVRSKVLMQALRRAAPEVWADPKETPPDARTMPQMITMTVIEPIPRQLPASLSRQNEDIPANAPSSERVN